MDLSRKGDELASPASRLMTEHRTGKNYRAGRGNVRFAPKADRTALIQSSLATEHEKRIRHRPPIVIVPLIIAAARHIAGLEVPIAPGKKEAVVVPEVVAHNEVIGRTLARDEAARSEEHTSELQSL